MKFLIILLTLAVLPLHSFAKENIRGLFFINPSPYMLGVRLVNKRKRTENHYVFDPTSRVHVDTKTDRFTLSAQLITPSYPIDCCEWKIIENGDTLTIEYFPEKKRCYCKITR